MKPARQRSDRLTPRYENYKENIMTNQTNHINKTAIITGASRGIGAAIAKSWLPVAITSHFAAAIHLTG